MPAVPQREIQDLSRAELEAWCAAAGEPRYRATQILAWVHRKGADGFARMSNLSRGLRARLDADFTLGRLAPVFVADAADGTRKLLFHLPGEGDARPAAIESVLIPQFEREAGARVNLAVSLSATTDAQRARLMPVDRRYPLRALLDACRALALPRRKRITFEYVMLGDENDGEADARRLVRLLHGLRAKVNLIPFNPFPGAGFVTSPRERIVRFQAILREHGVHATIRESRGQDIQAACGQLAAARAAA